ncbi:MAG: endopeptidase La [Deltaproteobacteria bacterium]|nr:MAG: endopeptidase La [Deltaproteobacteria bacterium]
MSEFESENKIYPLMPLRDIVVFPHMVAPLVVGRQKSIKALESAMSKKTEIFLVTQRDANEDEPQPEALHTVGTIAVVMQLLRLPDGTIKALVEGKRRGSIKTFQPQANFMAAEIEEAPETDVDGPEVIAYMREIRAAFEEYIKSNKKIPKEVLKSLGAITDPSRFVDVSVSHLPLQTGEKQEILEVFSVLDRFRSTLEFIQREIEIAKLEHTIRTRVKKKMEKTQKDYYLNEQMRVIQQEMGGEEDGSGLAELENAIKNKKLPKHVSAKVEQEFKKLKFMQPMSAEATVVRNYIDIILSLPWYEKTKSKIDINEAEAILEEDHYGLKKPKERIIEYLAVQAQVKKIKGPILCLVGPPGVGKTSLCKSIARAMDRKYIRLSLGGVRDEAEIRGHRRTYIGALPGKILQSMQKAKVINPLFCLDEVDKMSMDFRGDPASALLEVLDPEQNHSFNDHYLDLDYDLSDIFFVTTANNLHSIPPPLQDRMEIIKLDGYTEEDKLKIAQGFLIPKQLEANGFKHDDIIFNERSIQEIIRRYTREAGVRNLERNIASVCRKVARERLKKNELDKKFRITAKTIQRYLGIPRFRFGLAEEKDEVGLSTGLAWTEVGGELLQIETTLMPGKGKLTITGKLGDVMQESAQAALSYVRSRALRLGLMPDFYQKLDIHVHVPEGAIPKDGPSAGITMATSMVSALLKTPVRRDIAMTGEITLRGRVLPIGGLTEKLLAARRGNIKHVLIPKENERNLKEVPMRVRKLLKIELVEHMDEVLQKALVLKEGASLFTDVPIESVSTDITASVHNVPH